MPMDRTFHSRHDRIARIMSGTGAIWVSRDEVLNRASLFDDSMWKFSQDLDKAYPQPKDIPPPLLASWSSLHFDWYGDDEALKDNSDFVPGYYRTLKDKLIIGESELNAVKIFEDRLKGVKTLFAKYGKKQTVPDNPDPNKYEPTDQPSWTFVQFFGLAVLGVAALYFLAPIFTSIGAASAARAAIGRR